MGMDSFKIIIVEDVKLELKGTEEIIRTELPEAKIIGTAMNESEFWCLIKKGVPDLLLLDLGLGGSTTIGVDICRQVRLAYPELRILIFTGEILNERLWADVLKAGANGIILKTGELLTRNDVRQVMDGRNFVFNEPILEKIVSRFMKSVESERLHKDALIHYEIDEYDERFLRHLALGYTKEMITNLRGMPFGVKSLEKRQNDLISRLFDTGERGGINATRLVVKALQLHIIDLEHLEPDEEKVHDTSKRTQCGFRTVVHFADCPSASASIGMVGKCRRVSFGQLVFQRGSTVVLSSYSRLLPFSVHGRSLSCGFGAWSDRAFRLVWNH